MLSIIDWSPPVRFKGLASKSETILLYPKCVLAVFPAVSLSMKLVYYDVFLPYGVWFPYFYDCAFIIYNSLVLAYSKEFLYKANPGIVTLP